MSVIAYPLHPDREAYALTPWTDADGAQWLWNSPKSRWNRAVASSDYFAGPGITISGKLISLSAGSSISPDRNTYVLRDNLGITSSTGIRLFSGRKYAQIVAPSGMLSDLSFFLPPVAGTLLVDGSVVTLAGAQQISGAKTFGSQVQMTSQAATDANSALTRGLADARYMSSAQTTYLDINPVATDFLSIVLQPLVSLFLPQGVYELSALLSSVHGAGGCQIRFNSSASIKVALNDSFGKTTTAPSVTSMISDNFPTSPVATERVRADATAGTFRRSLSGIIEVLTAAGTTLTLDYACNTVVAAGNQVSRAQTRPYIIARKIG